ncbi:MULTISPECIES: helix-turn-helix domain-containing protein [Cellulophaga]|uniref:Helix-turn-helix domain protein n=2 Tax=Cellulophaga TaxID=104264 RepID=F0RD05_CELLC|nr:MULTISPECIES: helix-turn-helix domain-containing protein [Cellulophaga]ADY28692.1 helix-turn-helix domain protein [Cellulophaga lytica DSM 7489]EWH13044.1 helix-turn-helix domain-containing protein [Cellulophaga geojensis KL-A]MDO6853993.1 helix-turn-helix domain-containing protein [Cellulophaga lytica]TVZ08746.1 XRE family transcriptional regulator [Cellulophaga sp. RHA_52]WQG77129.1 helix-turn-helix domain-containing protein [Cellulophaga lytica]
MDDILINIGRQLKLARQKRNLTLQQVAKRTGVSAGLISKIENLRTTPSLPVLLKIMQTLQIELSELELSSSIDGDYILIKKGTGTREDREDSEQLEYTHLLSNTSKGESIRVYLITVLPLAVRKPISTNANELVYVLSGSPTYTLKGNEVTLDQGDLLFFDGTVAHGISNKFNEPAVLLKVYLLH